MPSIDLGGYFQGGFVEGLRGAQEQELKQKEQARLQQGQDFDQKKQLYVHLVEQIDQAGEMLAQHKAINPDSPVVKEMERMIAQTARQAESLGGSMGMKNPLVGMAANKPDEFVLQKMREKAAAEAVGTRIDALSQIPGADRNVIMQRAGLKAEPKKEGTFAADPSTKKVDALRAALGRDPTEAEVLQIFGVKGGGATTGKEPFSMVHPITGEVMTTPDREPSAGDEQRDKEYAKEFESWSGRKGVEAASDAISKLTEALKYMEENNVSGPIAGLTADEGFVGSVATALNPLSRKTIELVAAVSQKDLRETLGGQFAQKEGEQLIKRAYNPNLPEDMNARNVRALIESIRRHVEEQQAKAKWFGETGSLAGYTPSFKLPTPEEIYETLENPGKKGGDSGGDNDDGWGILD